MEWPETAEKTTRAILWVTLSSVFVLVPITVIGMSKTEAQLKEDAKKAEERIAELSKPPKVDRFALKGAGAAMTALNVSEAEGRLFFTNVSPRSGVLCVHGVATNPVTSEKNESLSTCEHVQPYATVTIKVMFAGTALREACKNATCRLTFEETPDTTAP